MNGLILLHPLLCPGCKSKNTWKVAIDILEGCWNRMIIDCSLCGYRISLPLDLLAFEKISAFRSIKSILDYDLKEKLKR
jgi:hypothetical protein